MGYVWAGAATLVCSLIGGAMASRFDPVNIAMVYLLAVVIMALRWSRGPAIATAGLSIVTFNFLFIPPRLSFAVGDVQYLLTFAIMLAVALVIAGLKASVRRQADAQAALALEADTERVRSTLLASISHDLRTPLSVITGASSSLAEKWDALPESTRRELAGSVYEQARELSEQVAKVLQMTRLETGAIALERDWDSIPDIAGSVLARLEDRLRGHRVMIEFPGDFPLVRVDAVLIEQALGNLLENAARYTPPGTLIRVRGARKGDTLVVSVEDYGPGIAPGDVDRVFAKFHRGAAEGAGGGVGLGLSICRAIVQLHGGRAWAEQLSGGGTAFRFSLPLEKAPEMPVETQPAG
jgi:two-component system sensor histidine kinase KdpD